MNISIDFDGKLFLRAEEINDINADSMLTTEIQTVELVPP
jgi:hypothetical protein